MDFFIDLELRSDPEFGEHLLLGALYDRVHRVLSANKSKNIAVCFPGYQLRPRSLGKCMRLFGGSLSLEALASVEWLRGVRDHVSVGTISKVPEGTAHRAIRRVQAKSNAQRLRRRLIKRHNLDEAQALQRIPDSAAEMLSLPYAQLRSSSTANTFKLFLRLEPEQAEITSGDFNSYGLSRTATIPWF